MLCSEVRLLCDVGDRVRAAAGEESCGESGRFICGERERLGEVGGDVEQGEFGSSGGDPWLGVRDRLGEADRIGDGGGGEGGGWDNMLLGV